MHAVEICCGHGGLSRELRQCGWRVKSIDYGDNKLNPCVRVTNRDLREPADVRDVLAMVSDAGYVHMAPPCGTFSRAREIRNHGVRPLRDAGHVEGLPSLSPAEKMRVESANAVTDSIIRIMKACIRLDIPFTVENPTRSWIWQYRSMPDLCNQLYLVDFDMCMHGGKRKKATRLVTNRAQFKALGRKCDGKHEHLAWGITDGRFDTAAEAVYPRPFCKRLAKASTKWLA